MFVPLKGLTITPGLQEAAILTRCSWPYRVAARLLKKRSGVQISAEEMRILANQHGKQRADQPQENATMRLKICPSG
ncbi:MAG TPA: hypothetical protein VGF67_00710 [Ktedonobacteraceae bacterium]